MDTATGNGTAICLFQEDAGFTALAQEQTLSPGPALIQILAGKIIPAHAQFSSNTLCLRQAQPRLVAAATGAAAETGDFVAGQNLLSFCIWPHAFRLMPRTGYLP